MILALRIVFAISCSVLFHWLVGGHNAWVGLFLFLGGWWLSGKISSST